VIRDTKLSLMDCDCIKSGDEDVVEDGMSAPLRETEFMGFDIKMLEKRAAQAFVGYLSMNVYEPPSAATWGLHNDRKIDDTWVTDLVTAFKKSVNQTSEKNVIEMAMRPQWLSNREAVLRTVNGLGIEEVPVMEFTEEGEAEMSPNGLIMLGGNHRRAAVRKYVDWLENQIVYEEKRLTLKPTTAPAEEVSSLRESIRLLKKEKEHAVLWVVKIYDLGE